VKGGRLKRLLHRFQLSLGFVLFILNIDYHNIMIFTSSVYCCLEQLGMACAISLCAILSGHFIDSLQSITMEKVRSIERHIVYGTGAIFVALAVSMAIVVLVLPLNLLESAIVYTQSCTFALIFVQLLQTSVLVFKFKLRTARMLSSSSEAERAVSGWNPQETLGRINRYVQLWTVLALLGGVVDVLLLIGAISIGSGGRPDLSDNPSSYPGPTITNCVTFVGVAVCAIYSWLPLNCRLRPARSSTPSVPSNPPSTRVSERNSLPAPSGGSEPAPDSSSSTRDEFLVCMEPAGAMAPDLSASVQMSILTPS